jgi:hypothetical protein
MKLKQKKKSLYLFDLFEEEWCAGGTRTPDLLVRSQSSQIPSALLSVAYGRFHFGIYP